MLTTILLPFGKGELEQAAGAAGVDVDDVVLQQSIGSGLDGGQQALGAAWYSASYSVGVDMVDRIRG